jgi:hypothetical protein
MYTEKEKLSDKRLMIKDVKIGSRDIVAYLAWWEGVYEWIKVTDRGCSGLVKRSWKGRERQTVMNERFCSGR